MVLGWPRGERSNGSLESDRAGLPASSSDHSSSLKSHKRSNIFLHSPEVYNNMNKASPNVHIFTKHEKHFSLSASRSLTHNKCADGICWTPSRVFSVDHRSWENNRSGKLLSSFNVCWWSYWQAKWIAHCILDFTKREKMGVIDLQFGSDELLGVSWLFFTQTL